MAVKATGTALKDEKMTGSGRKKTSGGSRTKNKTTGSSRGRAASRKNETMASRSKTGKGSARNKKAVDNTGRKAPVTRDAVKEGIPMGNEVTLVVSAGLAVLMMLSNFGLCGWIGKILSSLFFGVFGFAQYMMPLVFMVMVLVLVANDYSSLSVKKCAALFGLMMIISGFSQLIAAPEGYEMDAIFGDSAINHFLGGVIAGGITEFLRSGFGVAGAVIILVCLLVVTLVVLTQRSAIAFFKDVIGRIRALWDSHKENVRIRKEEESLDDDLPVYEDMDEDWSFPDETGEDSSAKGRKKVEDKVRAIEDEIQENKSRRSGKKSSGSDSEASDTDSSVRKGSRFVSDDKVRPKDSLRELHPEIFPLAEEDGKTDPFDGELDYSAFDQRRTSDDLEISEDLMRAVKGETGKKTSRTVFTPSLEEIRIHHGEEDDFVEETDDYNDIIIGPEGVQELSGDNPDWPEEIFSPEEHYEEVPVSTRKQAGEDESFHIVEEGPEAEEMDPKQAMRMSRTPVTSREKKGGLPAMDPVSEKSSKTSGKDKSARTSGTQGKSQAEEPVVHKARDPKPVMDMVPKKAAGKAQYIYPPITLLTKDDSRKEEDLDSDLKETAMKLQQTLQSFGVNVKITDISCGPSVTRYELFPEQGVKVSKIVSLTDDIKLNLAAADVRIEAPIPGKAAIGIEVPNKKVQMVHFRDLIDNKTFRNMKSRLSFAAGKDIGGKIVMADLAKMPHMLVAGTTGSGKSVFINTIIMSILYKASPEEVRFIMVDPKMVELSVYNGIPHLLIPVVTDPKKASGALAWAVAEMTERYRKFAETGTRNLSGYNKKVEALIKAGEVEEGKLQKLPQIVIIIDELADLMMVAKSEVEDAIVRLSQLARAAGIHMVIATQRPSVDVITGLIKANVPSRVALSVSSGTDSRTILDMNGAEKLLGNGDMLFYPSGYQKPVRVQGAYISDEDIAKVTDFLKENEVAASYDTSVTEKIEKKITSGTTSQDRDEYFEAAARFIMEKDKATIGMLQRMFKIGFNRAARIIDQLCEAGIVGPEEGTKPRKILMSPEELDTFFEENA